uniref:Uncharacterized protein n=1 Tax=Ditylenchus dipsaci TaxID=166011 RepID=A0A915DZU8_9BILA
MNKEFRLRRRVSPFDAPVCHRSQVLDFPVNYATIRPLSVEDDRDRGDLCVWQPLTSILVLQAKLNGITSSQNRFVNGKPISELRRALFDRLNVCFFADDLNFYLNAPVEMFEETEKTNNDVLHLLGEIGRLSFTEEENHNEPCVQSKMEMVGPTIAVDVQVQMPAMRPKAPACHVTPFLMIVEISKLQVRILKAVIYFSMSCDSFFDDRGIIQDTRDAFDETKSFSISDDFFVDDRLEAEAISGPAISQSSMSSQKSFICGEEEQVSVVSHQQSGQVSESSMDWSPVQIHPLPACDRGFFDSAHFHNIIGESSDMWDDLNKSRSFNVDSFMSRNQAVTRRLVERVSTRHARNILSR